MTAPVSLDQTERRDLEIVRPLSVPFPTQVTSLVQTCGCHPSQWEGWTSDGQAIYVRFRYGRLWIGLAPEYEPSAPTMLFVARYRGDEGDAGHLRYETLQRLTAGVVEWP